MTQTKFIYISERSTHTAYVVTSAIQQSENLGNSKVVTNMSEIGSHLRYFSVRLLH